VAGDGPDGTHTLVVWWAVAGQCYEIFTAELDASGPCLCLSLPALDLCGWLLSLPNRHPADWSYQLLDDRERLLFAILSVFTGFSFEAVEGVTSRIERLIPAGMDILDGLTSLVEKSLIRQTEEENGEPRFWMLETIREYASQRLTENPELSAKVCWSHASYFAQFAHDQWEWLSGNDREAAIAVLATEIENVRIAWRYWVKDKNLEQLGKMTDSLWLLYDSRGWYHATVDLTTDLLNVLADTPSTPERVQEELILRTSLARALLAVKGYTPEVEKAYLRALDLSQTVAEISHLHLVLRGLSSFYLFRGEFEKGVRVGQQMLELSERYDDPMLPVEGHLMIGVSLPMLGDIPKGLEYLEQGIAAFNPEWQPVRRFRMGNNPGVACYTTAAMITWMNGFPDRARRRAQEAIEIATRLNHPYSLAYAYFHASLVTYWLREAGPTREYAQAAIDVAQEHEFAIWNATGLCLHGAALADLGKPEKGLDELSQGMQIYQGLRTPPIFWPLLLAIRAGACAQAGQLAEASSLMDEALKIPVTGTYGPVSGELHRLKGEILLAQSLNNADQAEPLLQGALNTAQNLKSAMMELRAAMSLARLRIYQGNKAAAQAILSSSYAKLTEGFTTPDLMEAKGLLETLGSPT
jgi:predicted ATPase